MKLIDKWNILDAEFNEKINNYTVEFLKMYTLPNKIYRLDSYNKITEFTVASIWMSPSGKPYYDKKPTKLDVENLENFIKKCKLSNDMFYLRLVDGNCSTSVSLYNLESKKDYYATNIDDLIPYQNILKEKYEPREGYFACSYCHIQTPNDKKIKSRIYANQYNNSREFDYCSNKCASYDQMGHEG